MKPLPIWAGFVMLSLWIVAGTLTLKVMTDDHNARQGASKPAATTAQQQRGCPDYEQVKP